MSESTPTAALLSCHQALNAALVECPMTVVITVTLLLLPCLGEAKRSPHSPVTLQGNDGFPHCVLQATQWIPHPQPRGGVSVLAPELMHFKFGLKSLSSRSPQILTPFYLPTLPPQHTCPQCWPPSLQLSPNCRAMLWAGLTLWPPVISPVPMVPWLLNPSSIGAGDWI